MKSGFTLIELMIVLFISSIISVSLYMSFSVVSKMVSRGNEQVRSDFGFGLISNQLEKDLMGAFLPIISAAAPEAPAEESEETAQKEKAEAAKKTAAAKPATTKLERAFYCTAGKDGNFGILTFVTNNPLQAYSAERSGGEKPRVARVVYKLVPEPEQTTFALIRQESAELDYKAFESKNIRGYEIAQHIQSCKIELLYAPLEKKETAGAAQKKTDAPPKAKDEKQEGAEKAPTPFTIVSEWDDPKKDAEDKEQRPNLPQFIRLHITQQLREGEPLELMVQAPIFAWETVIRRADIELIQQTQKQEEQEKKTGSAEAAAKDAQAQKPNNAQQPDAQSPISQLLKPPMTPKR